MHSSVDSLTFVLAESIYSCGGDPNAVGLYLTAEGRSQLNVHFQLD